MYHLMEDGRWKMEDGVMVDGRGKRVDGRCKREDGRCKREDGRGKTEEGRGKMEEGRGKMEDIIFHRNLRLSSCILLPVSLLILQHHRICFGIVYHRGNRCDVRGQSSIRILLLLSML